MVFCLDVNVVLKIRYGKCLTCKTKFDKNWVVLLADAVFFFPGLTIFSSNLVSFVCLFLYMYWMVPRLHAEDLLHLFFSVTSEHYNICDFVEVFVIDIFFLSFVFFFVCF